MKTIAYGNIIYISAIDIHANIPDKTLYNDWMRNTLKNLKPLPGGEHIEQGGQTYFSLFFAGILMSDCMRHNPNDGTVCRRRIADNVEKIYSLFNNGGDKKETHGKISEYEKNRIKLYDYIKNRKRVSKTVLTRRFNLLNRRQRNAILDELIVSELIEERFVRIDGSIKSTKIYSLIEENQE